MTTFSDNAYFLQAFANIGLVPDGGVTYVLPRIVGWRRAMDTARPSPEDILPPREAPRVEEDTYRAAPRSVVALFAFRMPR